MGINAQTSVPKFTSGDVLTAANTNLLTNAPPVFSGTATRDAAFGGAGEKTLAEGQLCYLEDSNIVQYYDGAAWATVGPTASAFSLIVAQTAFTSAASVSVNSCFTSTYTNYKLVLNITASSNNVGFKLRVSGTDSSDEYYSVNFEMYSSAAGSSGTGVQQDTTFFDVGAAQTQSMIEIFSPQVAQITAFAAQGIQWEPTTPRSQSTRTNARGNHNAATSYDGFTIYPLSGTMTGTYTLYGYAKA